MAGSAPEFSVWARSARGPGGGSWKDRELARGRQKTSALDEKLAGPGRGNPCGQDAFPQDPRSLLTDSPDGRPHGGQSFVFTLSFVGRFVGRKPQTSDVLGNITAEIFRISLRLEALNKLILDDRPVPAKGSRVPRPTY